MEYIYAVLLLHNLKKEITEENMKRVLDAAGAKADSGQVKAVIAALSGVNIDEVIKESAVAVSAASGPAHKEAKEEEKEEKVSEAEAAQGLGALFG